MSSDNTLIEDDFTVFSVNVAADEAWTNNHNVLDIFKLLPNSSARVEQMRFLRLPDSHVLHVNAITGTELQELARKACNYPDLVHFRSDESVSGAHWLETPTMLLCNVPVFNFRRALYCITHHLVAVRGSMFFDAAYPNTVLLSLPNGQQDLLMGFERLLTFAMREMPDFIGTRDDYGLILAPEIHIGEYDIVARKFDALTFGYLTSTFLQYPPTARMPEGMRHTKPTLRNNNLNRTGTSEALVNPAILRSIGDPTGSRTSLVQIMPYDSNQCSEEETIGTLHHFVSEFEINSAAKIALHELPATSAAANSCKTFFVVVETVRAHEVLKKFMAGRNFGLSRNKFLIWRADPIEAWLGTPDRLVLDYIPKMSHLYSDYTVDLTQTIRKNGIMTAFQIRRWMAEVPVPFASSKIPLPPPNIHSEPRYGSNRVSSHNIDLERIESGQDVRTTVMLRNVPNRMSQDEALAIIRNMVSFEFDFFYLRIDFNNGSNVGYGFVNLISPAAVTRFVLRMRGYRWPNSDKIADVTYATHQGRENLMSKFRNSAVREQPLEYRPRFFYTLPHPLAGREEPMPEPDCLSSLQRSRNNLLQEGLYNCPYGNRRNQPNLPLF